jgi:hypothetical protein
MSLGSAAYKLVWPSVEELITLLKDHRSTSMRPLSTIATICLSVAIATTAEVGAPIQAREGCSVTLFTGRDFTGDSTTISGNQCVSTDRLPTTSRTDVNGLAPF